MTTLTTPEDADNDSSEQPDTTAMIAIATDISRKACRFMKILGCKLSQRSRYGILTVTAPVGQRAAQGPQYQHSSTCMNALPVSGLMASESSGQISTHSVQPSIHNDSSMVTGTSARLLTSVMTCSLSGSRAW